ncbi:T-cell immunoglobulin and mucin domain-containing protein 4 [Gasterosteus aculeatus]
MRGFCYFYLLILTQVSSSTRSVIGFFGHNVTLACRYDTSHHGVLSFCWGRGELPTFKCSDTIVSWEDGPVPSITSPRYRLLGSTADGDVSLTILDAQRSDAGLYGCRVEIPGWFNDHKVNTRLVMEQEIVTTFVTNNEEVVVDSTLDLFEATSTAVKSKDAHGVGNIGRATAVFLSAIILILVLVFRRRFLPKRPLEHPQTSPAENVYEVL